MHCKKRITTIRKMAISKGARRGQENLWGLQPLWFSVETPLGSVPLKSFAYRGAHLWNNLESEVKKHPLYSCLNIVSDIFLFLCYFSIILIL